MTTKRSHVTMMVSKKDTNRVMEGGWVSKKDIECKIEVILSQILSRKYDAEIKIKFEEDAECQKQKTK